MRRYIFALGLIVCSVMALAKDKVEISSEPLWLVPVKVDPDKKPDIKNVSNGFFLELFDNQMNFSTQTSYTHIIRNIVNESGVQNASEISVNFVPSYQTVIFHKVSIIRAGEVINQLNAKKIRILQDEADADNFQYSGNKKALIILTDVRKNDRIEFSYSVVGTNPIFDGKYSVDLSFFAYNPITNIFKTIIADTSKKLNFKYFLDAPRPSEEIKGNKRIYHWNNPQTVLYESQPGAPSWYEAYPYITITEFNSWAEVVNWDLKLVNNYQFELPAALVEKINQWKKASNGDKDEFARLAIRYVQDEIRYLGLEEGIHTHKPHHPADVFNNGYGDCKDKSLLLSMILRADSIIAYSALINTTKKSELLNAAPNPQEFDHVIVAIERKNTLKFVDPTISMQKGSLENNFVPAYGSTLVIREKETDLWTMSVDGKNLAHIEETFNVTFDDTTHLQVSSKYYGSKADNTRSSFSDFSANDMKKGYVDYYSPLFKDISMNGDIDYYDDSSTNTIVIKENYSIPSLWTKDEKGEKSFQVSAKAISTELTEPSEEGETYPLALKFRSEVQYTMNINMPEDWSFTDDDVHILTADYQFDFTSSVIGNKITLTYYYKSFSDHIATENLAEYRADYKKMTGVLDYTLYYSPGGNSAPTDGNGVHWPALWITCIAGALTSFLLVKLDKRNIDVEYDRNTGWPIGGWMLVLGISLGIGVLIQFYSLFFAGFFKGSTWEFLQAKSNGILAAGYVELAFCTVKFAASIAVFIWFLKRRDIFPRMFIFYIGTAVTMQLSLWICYYFISMPEDLVHVRKEALRAVIQLTIYATIWCTYVLRSYRAKATFLKAE